MQTPFAIDVSGSAENRLLALRGELDLAHAQSLEETITRMCAGGAREIVLDLSSVEFIDSSGLRALIASRGECEEYGCRYVLRSTLPVAVKRLFEVAGVGERFEYTPADEESGG